MYFVITFLLEIKEKDKKIRKILQRVEICIYIRNQVNFLDLFLFLKFELKIKSIFLSAIILV